jgi:CRP-like cAMP-binding protein
MRHSNRKNFLPNDFDELLDILALLNKISGADRDALLSLDIALKQYPPRTVIRRHGEWQNRLFLIRSGWASTYILLPDGGRQITDFHVRGDLVVNVNPMKKYSSDSFQAISELSVFEIPSREFLALLENGSTSLSSMVLAALSRIKAISGEHLANLGRRRAAVRTAHLILELGVRLNTVGLFEEDGYDCPLTQNDLADALGLTTIHMSRTLRELRESGWMNLHNGRVTFMDRDALVNFAQFDPGYLFDTAERG